MARTKPPHPTTTTTSKPSSGGLLSRLRNRNQAKVSTTQTTNPITGSTTTTQKTTTHPNGVGYRGHGGHGPLASNHESHYTSGKTTTGTRRRQKRKPGVGDKVSGALMKLRGSLTRRPGKKAAGTRRMNGTDGKGGHKKSRVVV